MRPPPVPHDESVRLKTLCALKLLDTPAEDRFDRYSRLAQRLFDVPIALMSLVDAERQWFKSRQGLDTTETPRDTSFCGHCILGEDALIVPDAAGDERFHDNPLVTVGPEIRFYAGYPLKAPNGAKIGTLCVMDRRPREFTGEDIALLGDLGRMVEAEIASLALATVDDLTGLSNRRGFSAVAEHALTLCRRNKRPATLLYFDLDEFKPINDEFGHGEGDRALREFSDLLVQCFRESDLVARVGGDEFCVLLTGAGAEATELAFARFDAAVHMRNAAPSSRYALAYSVGAVLYDTQRDSSAEALLDRADQLMYAQKRQKQGRRVISLAAV